MYNEDVSIYKNARTTAGFTQERWAELLGVSVESVRCYENGTRVPPDEIVLAMVDITGNHWLANMHLRQRSELVRRYYHEITPKSLLQLAVMLNNRMKEFVRNDVAQRLMEMAEDGQITEDEVEQFKEILHLLDEICAIAMSLKMGSFGG